MLVRLYALPSLEQALDAVAAHGIVVKRAIACDKPGVMAWVLANFPGCVAEVETAFAQVPARVFVALREGRVVGFACHDVTARNFFGPEGVDPSMRGKGAGRALLLCALHAMRAAGYAYAIVGGVGPAEFYARCAGAVPIEGSTPGLYRDRV
ncbi:MAG: GNAT family N-acetyltransferase [Burkholderiales bacterium]